MPLGLGHQGCPGKGGRWTHTGQAGGGNPSSVPDPGAWPWDCAASRPRAGPGRRAALRGAVPLKAVAPPVTDGPDCLPPPCFLPCGRPSRRVTSSTDAPLLTGPAQAARSRTGHFRLSRRSCRARESPSQRLGTDGNPPVWLQGGTERPLACWRPVGSSPWRLGGWPRCTRQTGDRGWGAPRVHTAPRAPARMETAT